MNEECLEHTQAESACVLNFYACNSAHTLFTSQTERERERKEREGEGERERGREREKERERVRKREKERLCLQGCAHPLNRSERERGREREREKEIYVEYVPWHLFSYLVKQ
jgi:dephospho-CoA kinase